MAQANAQIGIATAAFFPNVILTAEAGFESTSFLDWLTWPSRFWSVGPALAQTLFDAGLRRATVEQYQASFNQAVASYRGTVLTAFQQVEDNLATLRILAREIQQQGYGGRVSGQEPADRHGAVPRGHRPLSQRHHGANDASQQPGDGRHAAPAADDGERSARRGARRELERVGSAVGDPGGRPRPLNAWTGRRRET
jgi:Outer membrane protein